MALGINYRRLFIYTLPLTAVVVGSSFFLSTEFEPWVRRKMAFLTIKRAEQHVERVLSTKVKASVFTDEIFGNVLYAENVDKVDDNLWNYKNIIISTNYDQPKSPPFLLTAKKGSLSGNLKKKNLTLRLYKGHFISFSKDEKEIVNFEKSELDLVHLFRDQMFPRQTRQHQLQALSLASLREKIDELKNNADTNTKEIRQATYLFYFRILNSLATLSFSLLSLALLVIQDRKKSTKGYAFAALATFLYWSLIMMSQSLQSSKLLGSLTLAASPQLIFLLLAAFLFRKRCSLPPSISLSYALFHKLKKT